MFAVVESLKEADDRLFTFLKFPKSQRKALLTMNALAHWNESTKSFLTAPKPKPVFPVRMRSCRSVCCGQDKFGDARSTDSRK